MTLNPILAYNSDILSQVPYGFLAAPPRGGILKRAVESEKQNT
jgi:hypothetical protein